MKRFLLYTGTYLLLAGGLLFVEGSHKEEGESLIAVGTATGIAIALNCSFEQSKG